MVSSTELKLLKDREARLARYGSLNKVLPYVTEVPNNVVEILDAIDPSHPKDLEKRLRPHKGMRIDFVGGGMEGTTSAYVAGELSRLFDLNWDVHVWERLEYVGLKSTKDSAARTRTTMFITDQEVLGNVAGSLFFENLDHILKAGAKEAGVPFDYETDSGLHRCGYMWLFESQDGFENVKQNQEHLAKFDIPTFILEPEEVAVLMPGINTDRFKFGYLGVTDASVEPTNIVNALQAYSSKVLGVKFHFDEEVTGIRINTDEFPKFNTLNLKTGKAAWHSSHGMILTTGACTKIMGQRFEINGSPVDLEVPVIPIERQITYAGGFTPEELRELEFFTILMGEGAYFSRESINSNLVMIGFARGGDPEVPADKVFEPTNPNLTYFIEKIMKDGGLDGIHQTIRLDSERLTPQKHGGNLYGETKDGNYLIGLLGAASDAKPLGKVGINAAHNGHGIMASLGTAVHVVYRLFGIRGQESTLYDPGRDTRVVIDSSTRL